MRKIEYKTEKEKDKFIKEATSKGEVLSAEENLIDGNFLTFTDDSDVDIEKLKTEVIQSMSSTCRDKIINEFYSDCLGESKRFDCEVITDQPKIIGYYFSATLLTASQSELMDVAIDKFQWKASGELMCYPWTPRQIIKLGEDMQNHITEKTKRFDYLRIWALDNSRTVSELRGWTWDMPLGNS